jgi:hypothetical protein
MLDLTAWLMLINLDSSKASGPERKFCRCHPLSIFMQIASMEDIASFVKRRSAVEEVESS